MITKIMASMTTKYIAICLMCLVWIYFSVTTTSIEQALLALGSSSILALMCVGAYYACRKLVNIQRLRHQKNRHNRGYLEQRLGAFMKGKIIYHARCPYSDERVEITATTTLFRKNTFWITFVTEEYVRPGDGNGNINERQTTSYALAVGNPDIHMTQSSKQIYADQTVHKSFAPTHTSLEYLPEDVFTKIEEVLLGWEQSTVDI